MLATRADAEQRYNKIRTIALEVAQNSINDHFKLTKITSQH
jgi:hypothetical protein